MVKVFLDFETGGLNPEVHSPLQLAVMFVKNNDFETAVAEEMYVKLEDYVLTPKAMEINGLDLQEIYSKGKTPREIVQIFKNAREVAKEKLVIVGQNVNFDINFLKALFKLANCEKDFSYVFSYRSIDLQSILFFLNDTKVQDLPDDRVNLDTAMEFYNVPIPKDRHTALADIISTAKVYEKAINLINLQSFVC